MNSPRSANKFMMCFLIYTIAVEAFSPIIFGLAALPLMTSGISKEETLQWLVMGQDLIVFFVPMAGYLILSGNSIKDILPLKRLSLKNGIYVVIITLLMMPMMMVFSNLTNLFVDSSVNDTFDEMLLKFPWWASIICMAVMPPIFEESMFRGFILTGYKRTGFVKAVLVSALFFGMMHMDLYQLPYATFAGVIFASFVYYTGSIWASMLAHLVVNGSQTVLFLISTKMMDITDVSELATYQSIDEQIAGVYAVLGLMIVTLPFLLYFVNRFVKRNKQNCAEYCGEQLCDGAEQSNQVSKHRCIDRYFVLSVIIYIAYMYISKFVLNID